MRTKLNDKRLYLAPEIVVVQVRLEGVIAASGIGLMEEYGEWITNEWGNEL